MLAAYTTASGICGSDLHMVDEFAAFGDEAPRIVLGHEFCAEILERGPETSGRFECVGVGVAMKPDTITPVAAILKEVSIAFVYAYRQEEFAHALGLLAGGRVDAAAFVTGGVGLDGVAGAFAELAEATGLPVEGRERAPAHGPDVRRRPGRGRRPAPPVPRDQERPRAIR